MDIKRAQERKAAGLGFDHEAAARRAAAAAEAPAAQESSFPVRRSPGGSIFHRHRQRLAAGEGARLAADGGANDNAPRTTAEAEIRLQLLDHKRSLKQIQSREAKVALKREILPLYAAWCEGVLLAGNGAPDEVLSTILIWRIDVGDFFGALPLIEYVLRWKLDLPAHIDRTPATFITEEIAEAAIKAFDAGGDAANEFPAGILAAIEALVDDEDPDLREDMPDEVRAKLQKAIGRAVIHAGDDERSRQEETLRRYLRALELDPKAGVKKQIEQLQRQLNKPAEPVQPVKES